jgi:hypothetical protein
MKIAFLLLTVTLVGCNKPTSSDGGKAAQTAAKPGFDPCESLRQLDPHCGWNPHWDDAGVSTNAIDGTKTEFLSLDSTDADGTALNRLSYAKLKICSENGRLCRNKRVGVGVTVHGMIDPVSTESQYHTPVRIKFDDDKPSRQTWGIADSHDALFPAGREEQFLLQLLEHKKLILEFSYYEKAPRTLTFELSGLEDKLKSVGIDAKAQAAAKESALRARQKEISDAVQKEQTEAGKKIAQQIGLCQNKNFPNEFCWEPVDGSGPWGPFPTREVATKYALERYHDHSKAP